MYSRFEKVSLKVNHVVFSNSKGEGNGPFSYTPGQRKSVEEGSHSDSNKKLEMIHYGGEKSFLLIKQKFWAACFSLCSLTLHTDSALIC